MQTGQKNKQAVSPPGRRSRTWFFRSMMLSLPIVILGGIELILRIFSIFPQPPLYTKIWKQGRQVYQINQHIATRYFDPRQVTVPGALPETFAIKKSANTFRIFCLGGSTTAGFPFDCQVSFPQQLRYALRQAYPEREFEVINLGISAINSYSVLDMLPEVLKLQPDLLIIYMGHNEFYGAFGSASAFGLPLPSGFIRLYLRLQKMHLVQMLKSALSFLVSRESSRKKNLSLMAAVVREQQVKFGSDLYRSTLAAFRTNLQRIVASCNKAGVPVILSNLVSNVRDLRPFSANASAGQPARQFADSLLAAGDASAALSVYRYIWQEDSTDAAVWYGMGRALLSLGDSIAAAYYLYGAKDRDEIRFRASEETNEVIAELAQENQTYYVDMKKIFTSESASGIPGDDLFCDHLHPTPDAYFLMAKAFFKTMQGANLLGAPAPDFALPDQPYYVTDLDWDIGLLKIFEMVHRWPFEEKPVTFDDYHAFGEPKAAEIARHYLFVENVWSKAHYKMAEFYLERGEYEKARREYLAVSVFAPEDSYPYNRVAKTYELERKWDLREQYLLKELQFSTQKGLVHYQIAISQYNQGKLREACEHMLAAINSPELEPGERINARFYLAGFYYDLRQFDEAAFILQQILREHPDFQPARIFLGRMQAALRR